MALYPVSHKCGTKTMLDADVSPPLNEFARTGAQTMENRRGAIKDDGKNVIALMKSTTPFVPSRESRCSSSSPPRRTLRQETWRSGRGRGLQPDAKARSSLLASSDERLPKAELPNLRPPLDNLSMW
jgi:hypothetical protein